jgi:hypothetical protein
MSGSTAIIFFSGPANLPGHYYRLPQQDSGIRHAILCVCMQAGEERADGEQTDNKQTSAIDFFHLI